MKTALAYHPIYLEHYTGQRHPERPSRLESILRKLRKTNLIKKLQSVQPQAASIEDIALVHSGDYVLSIRSSCSGLSGSQTLNLDPDTVICKDSFDAALYAAGGITAAVDLIFDGKADNAFCLVRPPGHHAGHSKAMGFCLFNNIAIGARYIQKKYNIERILIIDWDVHHGNGTEEIFYNDPSVFYISLHQYPHYPGTGSGADTGAGAGKGFNLNVPMEPGSGDREYLKAFKEKIAPRVEEFKPEFVMISAGFDGHKDDPLSSINLTEAGYREMTRVLKSLAEKHSKGRIISVLEGGYNLLSLANSVNSHLEAMLA